ncbi:MAG: MBL fold metallo-hydrolase [Elusimicrobia bacterium]|nr:MBL fold metallo-hydrolase [Elusimicrobiota bacterium]
MIHKPNRAYFLAFLTVLALGLSSLQGRGDLRAAGNPDSQSAPPQKAPIKFKSKKDFSVILIGTGGPAPTHKRSNPSTLIQYKGHLFLVDMGFGTKARLMELDVDTGDIETMMFTHHHIDHDGAYIPLSMDSWLRGRKHLDLIGPPKTRALHEFLTTYYKEDMAYRKSIVECLTWDGITSNVDIKELKGNNSFVLHGVRITTTEVPHSIYTLAYRFDADGQSIVVSGDLTYSDNLIALAKDADILVIDSGLLIPQKPPEGLFHAQPGDHPKPPRKRAHCTLEEVATMAKKANVKKLVLTHFGPMPVDEIATLVEFRKIFSGEIIFGEDLLEIYPQISPVMGTPVIVHHDGMASPSRWSPQSSGSEDSRESAQPALE